MTLENEPNFIIEILKKSRKSITIIFISQTVLLLLSCISLFTINTTNLTFFIIPSHVVVINAALFGFIGSLIFFSRKSYVYLITNKLSKIIKNECLEKKDNNEIINIIRGYHLYLTFRPLVGIIIGPLIYMLILTGLITFIKISNPIDAELSRSGRFLIYFLSFIGGHASSDILDYFSKLAKKIIVNYTDRGAG